MVVPGPAPEQFIDPALMQFVYRFYREHPVQRGSRAHGTGSRSFWAAQVQLAHTSASLLAVLHDEDRRYIMLVVNSGRWFAEYPPHIMPIVPPVFIVVGPAALAASWEDPVVRELSRVALWSELEIGGLDGNSYKLRSSSPTIEATMSFFSPWSPGMRGLELAFLEVAEHLISLADTGRVAEYIDLWRGKVHR